MKEIKKVDTTEIEFSVPISNNTKVLQRVCDISTGSYINNEKNLSRSLWNTLKKAFGKPNKTMNLEYKTRVWVLEFKGLRFNVFTAKIKGTSTEIVIDSYDDIRNGLHEDVILEFVDKLYRKINQK